MLYIMRHGRTVWNMEHKLQGKTDVPLSEAGRPVVEQAAAAYRNTHIDVCYCSPLIRAMETAEIVLRGREIPIITDVRLEEMGFGICEGTTDFQDNPDNPIYPLFAAPETYRIPVEGGESLEDLYARTGAFLKEVIEPQLLQELQDADIFMVNNEFPFSNRGEPMEDKQFTFCCDPKYVKALNEMGVDIVSLANNHTLDYGRDALSDTFTTLDGAGILYAGAGETKERAYELQIIEKNGKKFGFLAASRVVPESNWKVEERTPGMLTAYDDTKLVQLIKEARSGCDFLSVYIHWGVEYDAYPQDYQTKIATDCFNAGADLILGAHTHCLQGISYISGKPVFYSLGNFVFGQNIDKTAAVKVQVSSDGTVSYGLLPVYAAGGTTKLMDTNSASALYQYMTQISDGVTIGADGKIN